MWRHGCGPIHADLKTAVTRLPAHHWQRCLGHYPWGDPNETPYQEIVFNDA